MLKPAGFDSLSVSVDQIARGPYPPLGFLPVLDAELGNGDYFGLYWPLGRERNEPVVCDMLHDEWRLRPSFSNVQKFHEWLQANDGERGESEIEDAGFAIECYARARAHINLGIAPEAIVELRRACNSFPDVSDYWMTLAGQLRRIGQQDQALEAALNAYRANWAFGRPPEATLRMLKGASRGSGLYDDPLMQRIDALSVAYGGTKENANYALLKECIQEYFSLQKPLHALHLSQNHAYMMCGETTSFQERNGFSLDRWQFEFSSLCEKHLGDSRTTVT